jgi:hypothetical protein
MDTLFREIRNNLGGEVNSIGLGPIGRPDIQLLFVWSAKLARLPLISDCYMRQSGAV